MQGPTVLMAGDGRVVAGRISSDHHPGTQPVHTGYIVFKVANSHKMRAG